MYWLRNTTPGVLMYPHLRDSSNGVLSLGPAGTHLQWVCVAESVLRDAHLRQHLEHRSVVPDAAYDAERSERDPVAVRTAYEAVFGAISNGQPPAAPVVEPPALPKEPEPVPEPEAPAPATEPAVSEAPSPVAEEAPVASEEAPVSEPEPAAPTTRKKR